MAKIENMKIFHLVKMVKLEIHRRRSNSDEGGDRQHCGANTADKLS